MLGAKGSAHLAVLLFRSPLGPCARLPRAFCDRRATQSVSGGSMPDGRARGGGTGAGGQAQAHKRRQGHANEKAGGAIRPQYESAQRFSCLPNAKPTAPLTCDHRPFAVSLSAGCWVEGLQSEAPSAHKQQTQEWKQKELSGVPSHPRWRLMRAACCRTGLLR